MKRHAARLVVIALVAGFIAIATTQSGGRSQEPPPTAVAKHKASAAASARVKPPMPYSRMTLQQRARFQERALSVYSSRWRYWRTHRERVLEAGDSSPRLETCRGARAPHWACWSLRASIWVRLELAETRAKIEYRRQWDWQSWLPDKFARVGACETGYGHAPGDWHWDSGRYVSAFGIYRPAYDQFASALGLPTWDGRRSPWEQFMVANSIRARFGWGAWGCGGR